MKNDRYNLVSVRISQIEFYLTLRTSGLEKLISATGPLAMLLNLSGNLTNISEARLALEERTLAN